VNARTLFIHALSPLHSGTGQALGVVDLPISREATTGWPMVPGSSIKGTLRDRCQGLSEGGDLLEKAFGPPSSSASDHAGELVFGDAQLLLLPVRSFFGTFAWATCPLALDRMRRDQAATGIDPGFQVPASPASGKAAVSSQTCLAHEGKVYLEDLDFEAKPDPDLDSIAQVLADQIFPGDKAWHEHLAARVLLLGDDELTYLAKVAVPVAARIRMDDQTKTVAQGGLWYEEYLPAETVLSAPLIAMPRTSSADELLGLAERLVGGTIQLGGKASVGRGLVRMTLGSGGDAR